MHIKADLESSPLEIKTDSPLGSDEKVEVNFYTSEGGYAGGVVLHFTSTPQYEMYKCTDSGTDFPIAVPTKTDDRVWRITLTRTSGIRLVIHCNEEEVVNVTLSDTTCGNSWWSNSWSRDVEKIRFDNDDTASDYFTGRCN